MMLPHAGRPANPDHRPNPGSFLRNTGGFRKCLNLRSIKNPLTGFTQNHKKAVNHGAHGDHGETQK